ncbi:nuclease, partial [Candidatus Shapirobacteria bacterium]
SKHAKVYHLPNCNEYKRTIVELHLGESWFCTEKEAQQAGYIKSKHCP